MGLYTIGGQGALELKDDFIFICSREKGGGEGLEGYYWITFFFADAGYPGQKFFLHFCCSLGFI